MYILVCFRAFRELETVGSFPACTQRLCCNITSFIFQNSPLSCAPNHPHVFFVFHCFPMGPPLLLSLSPPCCLSAFSLTHTLFPLHSLLQSKYYLTSSQRLSTSQQRFSTAALLPPLPAVTLSLQWGALLSCVFSRLKQSPVLYACSGYSAVS